MTLRRVRGLEEDSSVTPILGCRSRSKKGSEEDEGTEEIPGMNSRE